MAFSIRMAVNLMKLCIAAGQPEDKIPLGNIKLRGATLISKSRVDLHGSARKIGVDGFVAGNSVGDIVVVFAVSAPDLFTKQGGWSNWVLSEFDSKRVKHPRWPGKSSRQAVVHRGLWRAYDTIAADTRKAVSKFLKETYAKPVRILVTGHGLGGAIAELAAAELVSWFPKYDVSVYAFAAPRVGDASFSAHLGDAAKDCHRLANKGDPVPFIPPVNETDGKKKSKMFVSSGTLHILHPHGRLTEDVPDIPHANPSKHKARAYLKAIEAVVQAKNRARKGTK